MLPYHLGAEQTRKLVITVKREHTFTVRFLARCTFVPYVVSIFGYIYMPFPLCLFRLGTTYGNLLHDGASFTVVHFHFNNGVELDIEIYSID